MQITKNAMVIFESDTDCSFQAGVTHWLNQGIIANTSPNCSVHT